MVVIVVVIVVVVVVVMEMVMLHSLPWHASPGLMMNYQRFPSQYDVGHHRDQSQPSALPAELPDPSIPIDRQGEIVALATQLGQCCN